MNTNNNNRQSHSIDMIDVTDRSEREIQALEKNTGKISGKVRGRIFFPDGFDQVDSEPKPVEIPLTKKNRYIRNEYGDKGFNDDGTINYALLAPKDVVKEILARKDSENCKSRTNFMKRLKIEKLKKVAKYLPQHRCREDTKTTLIKFVDAYIAKNDKKFAKGMEAEFERKKKAAEKEKQRRQDKKEAALKKKEEAAIKKSNSPTSSTSSSTAMTE